MIRLNKGKEDIVGMVLDNLTKRTNNSYLQPTDTMRSTSNWLLTLMTIMLRELDLKYMHWLIRDMILLYMLYISFDDKT